MFVALLVSAAAVCLWGRRVLHILSQPVGLGNAVCASISFISRKLKYYHQLPSSAWWLASFPRGCVYLFGMKTRREGGECLKPDFSAGSWIYNNVKWHHRMQKWKATHNTSRGQVKAMVVAASGGRLSAGQSWRDRFFNSFCWSGSQCLVCKVFLVCYCNQNVLLIIKAQKKSWRGQNVYVETSWKQLVLHFHFMKWYFKDFWKIQLCCSKEIHASTPPRMVELLFEYCKISKQN